jgi:hypothetical protein
VTRRRRASAGRLIALIITLLLCIYLLYRLFIGIPAAPTPEVKTGFIPIIIASS